VASCEVLVAEDACKEKGDWMKRAVFLATAALLAMLILAPMAFAQGTTIFEGTVVQAGGGGGGGQGTTIFEGTVIQAGGGGGGNGSPATIPPTGGSAILLPVAVLVLGSGILTYAILRRR
jgi:hypothetical protein